MSAPGRVVVVGASLAGLRAVEALRRRDYDGPITVLGEEPHHPYDRPPLSKDVLEGKWDAARTALAKPEQLAGLDVEWRLGARATALDPAARQVTLADGEALPYHALVIATGAHARRLPGVPPELGGVFTLRTLDDALAIRAAFDAGARVCVVGAGFIGAEVAATARARGLEVTMLEALPVPLARALPAAEGERIGGLHRDHGVELRCGTSVQGLLGEARVEGVRLTDGTTVAADCVVVGIGVTPATAWLESSGLALDDGVLCDARCRASAPGIVAVGDVARWRHPGHAAPLRIEHWTNATEMADAAVAALLDGDAAPPFAPVPYFWSDQYDVKLQLAGRPAPDDEARLVVDDPERRRRLVLFGRAGRLTGALAWNRPRHVMQLRRALREGIALADAHSQVVP